MGILNLVPYSFIVGFLGLSFALLLYFFIKRYPKGNEIMNEIAEAVHSGAMIFLKREYSYISIFVIVIFIALWRLFSIYTSLAFLTGASCSMLAGFIGMKGSTRSAVRSTQGAITGGTPLALTIAFQGGAVMGISVAASVGTSVAVGVQATDRTNRLNSVNLRIFVLLYLMLMFGNPPWVAIFAGGACLLPFPRGLACAGFSNFSENS